jgi:hypothetical protein
MDVLVASVIRPAEKQLACHPEMEKESQTAARIKADHLAAPAQADDLLAF